MPVTRSQTSSQAREDECNSRVTAGETSRGAGSSVGGKTTYEQIQHTTTYKQIVKRELDKKDRKTNTNTETNRRKTNKN